MTALAHIRPQVDRSVMDVCSDLIRAGEVIAEKREEYEREVVALEARWASQQAAHQARRGGM
jgi:hypothetical protein